MKPAVIILFVLSFTAITIFGVFTMYHEMNHDNHSEICPEAMILGIDCPTSGNIFSSVVFHLGAFRSFSIAVFGQDALSPFFLVALLLVLIVAVIGKLDAASEQANSGSKGKRFSGVSRVFPRQHIIRWLSLFEHSPSWVSGV